MDTWIAVLQLFEQHPGPMWTSAVAFAFMAGGVWANYHYMRNSMVTKKDLEIALLRFGNDIGEKYATKEECKLLSVHAEKPNGGSRPFGKGE